MGVIREEDAPAVVLRGFLSSEGRHLEYHLHRDPLKVRKLARSSDLSDHAGHAGIERTVKRGSRVAGESGSDRTTGRPNGRSTRRGTRSLAQLTWLVGRTRARLMATSAFKLLLALVLAMALYLPFDAMRPNDFDTVRPNDSASNAPSQAPKPVSAQIGPPDELINYRLVDTWRDEPWTLEAGRFARASDISSDAFGPTYVLDRIQGAVHRRGADGAWSVVVLMGGGPESDRRPERLDVAQSGEYAVLWRGRVDGERRARVERYDTGGSLIGGFETGLDHNDVAIGPGGEIFLTRRVPRVEPTEEGPRPPGGVDIVQPDGTVTASIEGGDDLYFPSGIDVDSDGTVYVIDWRPSPEPVPPPFPRPTARPSIAEHPGAGHLAPLQDPMPPDESVPEGIVIFESDLRLRERVAFYAADDVAVGRAGAFVSRQLEIFELRETEAVWVGPAGSIYIPYYGAPVHIDVPIRGSALQASLDHCWFQGMLDFPTLEARPTDPVFDGRLDRPALAGPWRPARIATGAEVRTGADAFDGEGAVVGEGAGESDGESTGYRAGEGARAGAGAGVRVLQDRFQLETGADGVGAPIVLAGPWGAEPQSVQQWTNGGRLVGQLGVCGDEQAWFERRSETRRVLDIAVDIAIEGGEVEALTFTIEPELARAQSDDPARPLPLWTLWPGALDDTSSIADAALRAIDADRGMVAILDGGAGRVILSPARPTSDIVAESRVVPLGGSAAASVDLALRTDGSGSGQIALADAGDRSVRVLDLDGDVVGGWAVHDTPAALAYGPSGDLFVLGAGGWVLRYRDDGALIARWPMPESESAVLRSSEDRDLGAADPLQTLALDVTVDGIGRVLVPFVRRREHSLTSFGEAWWRVEEAGVWVFDETEPLSGEASDPSACLVATDKHAAPTAIRRGGLVDVRLDVRGLCPASRDRSRMMLVLDVSRSMSWDGALPRARALAGALVEATSDDTDQIGLVTFADSPALVAPLGSDRGAVLKALNAARAGGDTLLGPAIELAAEALGIAEGLPTPAGTRDVVVVLTDGRPSDYPILEANALRSLGVDLRFVVVPGGDYQAVFTTVLANLAGGDREKVLVGPEATAIRELFGTVSDSRRPDFLFETLEVVDEVPETMRYVDGSAEPDAAWNEFDRTLTWSIGAVVRDEPVVLRYRLEPLLDGVWPTNVFATAHGRDGAGFDHRLEFPVPRVSVWSPASLVELAYLPFTSALRCLRPAPRDAVLVIDASQSMDEPTRLGGPTKIRAAIDAAVALIERSSPERDRTAVVAFNTDARVLANLSAGAIEAVGSLERISTAPGTAIDKGLAGAMSVLHGARSEAVRAVLLLSDGRHAGDANDVRNAAAALKAEGAFIFAVAVGSDADEALLREISAGGGYAETDEAEGVARLFAVMDETLRCLPLR